MDKKTSKKPIKVKKEPTRMPDKNFGKPAPTAIRTIKRTKELLLGDTDVRVKENFKKNPVGKRPNMQRQELNEKGRIIQNQISDNIRKINHTLDALPISVTKRVQYEQMLRIQNVCLNRLELLIDYEERLDVVARVFQIISNMIDNIDSPDNNDARCQNFFESLADKAMKNSEYVEYEDI